MDPNPSILDLCSPAMWASLIVGFLVGGIYTLSFLTFIVWRLAR